MPSIVLSIALAVLTLVMIVTFPAASSMGGYHERYLHCPYPSAATYYTEFSITISKESSLQSCTDTSSCYIPEVLVVSCYSKVTWYNDDSNIHLISSGSRDHGPDGWFASKAIYPSSEFSFTLERPGIYRYYDPLHSWAQGTIIVKSGNNSTDAAWLNFVKGPNCTLGEPNCAHPSLR